MKRLLLHLCIFSSLTWAMNCRGASAQQPQAIVDSLAVALKAKQILRVEVENFPGNITSFSSFDQKLLDEHYKFKFIFNEIGSSRENKEIISQVEGLKVAQSDRMGDLRWAIVFVPKDQKGGSLKRHAIYFDKFGKVGAIDEMVVSFEGPLFGWLKSKFSDQFPGN